jgi:hypothetical protein
MMRVGGRKPGLLLLNVADLSSRYIGLANVICCLLNWQKAYYAATLERYLPVLLQIHLTISLPPPSSSP